jgi:hypothetical protein
MSGDGIYDRILPRELDENGDLAPPWERFPTYERYTIGWRMGAGEDWLAMWHIFLEQLASDFDTRLNYLKRHPAAPVTWADCAYQVLYPGPEEADEDDEEVIGQRRRVLLEQGVIASAVAFSTWLGQQGEPFWPWTICDTPESAARLRTRELWFWSRQIAALRRDNELVLPEIPAKWQPCLPALSAGIVPTLDLRQGLLSLAQMLSAGNVVPPWWLGLELRDFEDSFEDNMGYVDAFRLWGMSVFDDSEQLQRYLDETKIPKSWKPWVAEHFACGIVGD